MRIRSAFQINILDGLVRTIIKKNYIKYVVLSFIAQLFEGSNHRGSCSRSV